jgi:hypothetical protein
MMPKRRAEISIVAPVVKGNRRKTIKIKIRGLKIGRTDQVVLIF